MKNKMELIEIVKHLLKEHGEEPVVIKHKDSLIAIESLLSMDFINLEIHPSSIQKILEIEKEVHEKTEKDDEGKTQVIWGDPIDLASKLYEEIVGNIPLADEFIENIVLNGDLESSDIKVVIKGIFSTDQKNEIKDLVINFIAKNYPKSVHEKLFNTINIENSDYLEVILPLAIEVENENSLSDSADHETISCQEDVETEIDSEVLISDAEKDFEELLRSNDLDALIKTEDDGITILYKAFGDKLFMTHYDSSIEINLLEINYDLATSFSAILEKEVESDSLYIINFSDYTAIFITDQVDNPILLGVYDSERVAVC